MAHTAKESDPYKGLPFNEQVALAIKNAPKYRMDHSRPAPSNMDWMGKSRNKGTSSQELDTMQVGRLG